MNSNAAFPSHDTTDFRPSYRLGIIDQLRGLAVLMMMSYHFCFDLTYFGFAHFNMLAHPGWVAWRVTIVSTFLLLMGASLQLAQQHRRAALPSTISPRRGSADGSAHGSAHAAPTTTRLRLFFGRSFGLRWLQITAAALVVSIGSYLMFPAGYIYFGILHFAAVATLLCHALLRLGKLNLVLGIGLIVLGKTVQFEVMNGKALNWIGLVTQLPLTEDYVPLLPWLGVVLIGASLVHFLHQVLGQPRSIWVEGVALPTQLDQLLRFLGQHSLLIYLLHQPLIMAALYGVYAVVQSH